MRLDFAGGVLDFALSPNGLSERIFDKFGAAHDRRHADQSRPSPRWEIKVGKLAHFGGDRSFRQAQANRKRGWRDLARLPLQRTGAIAGPLGCLSRC